MSNLSLQISNNGLKLSDGKARIISLDEREKIPAMDSAKYSELCRQLLPLFFRDLGIKGSPSQQDILRFADMLLEHFRDFSLDEVKYAFELFIVGGMDHLFQEELKHYGEWSIAYMAKILRAYRTVRKNTRNEVYTLLPQKGETMTTEEEKAQIKRNFQVYILEVLIEAKKTGNFPAYHCTEIVHRTLVEMGLCQVENVNDAEIKTAIGRVMADENRSRLEKKNAREVLKGGEIGTYLQTVIVNVKVEKSIHEMLNRTSIKELQRIIETL